MRAVLVVALLALPAFALPPDWDRKTVSPACPACGATIGWGNSQCYSCQSPVDWKLPAAPASAEEAWRFLATAVARRDTDFIATLVEGDADENLRTLAIAPLSGFASSSPVEAGERVVAVTQDRGTALVLTWSKGKFLAAREAHRPLRNQVEAAKALRSAVEAERKLREGDLDGNGAKDWWAGDWSGLARLVDADGKPLALIPAELAAADLRPLAESPAGTTSRPRLSAASTPAPWNGFRFASLETDESGRPLAAAGPANPERFAFIAMPVEHGVTGWLTLLVSEDGVVWGKDLGAATGKDAESVAPDAREEAEMAEALGALEAEELETRDGAQARLRAFGRKAKPAMEAALSNAPAETRRRLRELLHDLDESAPDLRRWPAVTKDLLQAGWERV